MFLIKQNEVALPPGSVSGNGTTGAALILYDARLRKTQTIWERPADGGRHYFLSVDWLPGTDCVVAVTFDSPPPGAALPDGTKYPEVTLLFFDFTKGMTPRVLGAPSTDGYRVIVSPTKPLFLVLQDRQEEQDQQIRMGSAPRGTLGPALTLPFHSSYGYAWSTNGTSVFYGMERVTPQTTPNAKLQTVRKWYEWDGQAADPTVLDGAPKKAMMAQAAPPPALPIALRSTSLSIPTSLLPQQQAPRQSVAQAPDPVVKAATAPQTTLLHPLYLEATTNPTTPATNPNHSALLTPDADISYLLADQSAVLYESDGALYAVPLVRLKPDVYVQEQKFRTLQNALQVGRGIRMYVQDYDEEFPPQTGFSDAIRPYMDNSAAFQGFNYLRPTFPLSSVDALTTTVIGFISGFGGRAVLYLDGHVGWKDTPAP